VAVPALALNVSLNWVDGDRVTATLRAGGVLTAMVHGQLLIMSVVAGSHTLRIHRRDQSAQRAVRRLAHTR
jgi:hypothetical protein